MSQPVRFTPGARPWPPTLLDYWFLFRQERLLLLSQAGTHFLPRQPEAVAWGVDPAQAHFLGRWEGVNCWAAGLEEMETLPAGQWVSLRQAYSLLEEEMFWVAARAVQIVAWDRTHRYCGGCGAPTRRKPDEHVKICPVCGLTAYPRLAPAVIVAVEKEGRLLLAHNHRHPAGFYSVLAGFVEPGETLEQAVEREILEEVGVTVHAIRYFGSQPWPFPHSLMVAFTAVYAGGTLTLEDEELAHADWFAADQLPLVPPPMSIARRLIDDFVARHTAPPA